METKERSTFEAWNVDELMTQLDRYTHQYCAQVQSWFNNYLSGNSSSAGFINNLPEFYTGWTQHLLQNPEQLVEQQLQLWNKQIALWQYTVQRLLGQPCDPVIAPEADDRRFNDADWQNNIQFDFIKQSYLLNAQFILNLAKNLENQDAAPANKAQTAFLARQFVNALSPTNFAASNPEVMRKTMETGGANLLEGLKRLTEDLEQSRDAFTMSMSDLSAFELGRNLATTPGQVIYQNRLMQLIQYQPAGEQVFQRPLLIIPPWINKFYILDLREKNSLIRWLVEQGHTVFVISWVNPDTSMGDVSFDDYMQLGPIDAIEQIRQITGEKSLNAIGYCIGGTLLACAQAWLTAKKKRVIASVTFLTTLLDFSDPGEIGVFINEAMVDAMDKHLEVAQVYDGRAMALSFSMLRENDLFWSFFVSNYLKGERPTAFDLLYWNADSTNLPAAMHSYYLRQMYLNNQLAKPQGITLADVKIDLKNITTPCYFLSAEKDHIAKWTATYAGAKLVGGPVTFVLGGSGHIAGVINSPAAQKYGYWTAAELPDDARHWLQNAEHHNGSWWPHWQTWISEFAGKKIAARLPGGTTHPSLEPAPGGYVKRRLM